MKRFQSILFPPVHGVGMVDAKESTITQITRGWNDK